MASAFNVRLRIGDPTLDLWLRVGILVEASHLLVYFFDFTEVDDEVIRCDRRHTDFSKGARIKDCLEAPESLKVVGPTDEDFCSRDAKSPGQES